MFLTLFRLIRSGLQRTCRTLRNDNNDRVQPESALTRIVSADDVRSLSRTVRDPSISFLVSPQSVIWGYGFRHTQEGHPWVGHLRGTVDLKSFYRKYCRESLAALLFPIAESSVLRSLEISRLSDPELELAVGERVTGSSETVGEVALSRSHGTQHCGPLSDIKLQLEIRLLDSLYNKIRDEGYAPPKDDGIRGYFLVAGDSFAFRLVGGQHRAAVLAALEYEELQVMFDPAFPRVVDVESLPAQERTYLNALLDPRCHSSKCDFLSAL